MNIKILHMIEVPFMTGVDNYEFLIKQALGEEVSFPEFDIKHLEETYSIMRFFDFGSGKV